MRAISTRRARKLRTEIDMNRRRQARLDAYRLDRAKRDAAARIEGIKERLSPEYRLRLSQSLAQWEAHLDALEDDGGYAITKGHE